MSHAVVIHNTVENNTENGILVSDQSKAAVCDNDVSKSLPSITSIGERYGNGITIDFYSEVILQGNDIAENSNYGISILASSFVQMADNAVNRNASDTLWLDETSENSATPLVDDACSKPGGQQLPPPRS
jgi:parallel beta-helix repeat protein